MICIALWCNILDLAVEYVPLNAVDFGTQHHDTRFLLQNLDTYITYLSSALIRLFVCKILYGRFPY